MKYQGKPRWLTTELEEGMKERVRLRKKAKETRSMVDELDARRVRNNVGKKDETCKERTPKNQDGTFRQEFP